MQDSPEKEIFTPEEVALLFRYLEYDKVGLGIRIMLASGLRTQELLCLSPKHISEEGDRIIVEQAISLPGGRVTISTPKTQKSRRVVVLPESVHRYARMLRDTDDEFIYQSERNNMPINPSTFRNYYKDAIANIPGVRYLPPHSCRHTYASMLEAAHVSDKVIQSLLGQSCMRITHHYIHINDDGMTEAANKLSSIFR